jgi:hypothetical protein
VRTFSAGMVALAVALNVYRTQDALPVLHHGDGMVAAGNLPRA